MIFDFGSTNPPKLHKKFERNENITHRKKDWQQSWTIFLGSNVIELVFFTLEYCHFRLKLAKSKSKPICVLRVCVGSSLSHCVCAWAWTMWIQSTTVMWNHSSNNLFNFSSFFWFIIAHFNRINFVNIVLYVNKFENRNQ